HLPVRQSDRAPRRLELRVLVLVPQLVEDRRLGQLDRVAGAGRREAPAVEDHEADRGDRHRPWTGRPAHAAASTIRANVAGSRLAPPTSAPSMSAWVRISPALSGVTLPPYWIRTRSAKSAYL